MNVREGPARFTAGEINNKTHSPENSATLSPACEGKGEGRTVRKKPDLPQPAVPDTV
jgi:hypothetical protein